MFTVNAVVLTAARRWRQLFQSIGAEKQFSIHSVCGQWAVDWLRGPGSGVPGSAVRYWMLHQKRLQLCVQLCFISSHILFYINLLYRTQLLYQWDSADTDSAKPASLVSSTPPPPSDPSLTFHFFCIWHLCEHVVRRHTEPLTVYGAGLFLVAMDQFNIKGAFVCRCTELLSAHLLIVSDISGLIHVFKKNAWTFFSNEVFKKWQHCAWVIHSYLWK